MSELVNPEIVAARGDSGATSNAPGSSSSLKSQASSLSAAEGRTRTKLLERRKKVRVPAVREVATFPGVAQVCAAMRAGKDFLVTSHLRPDGDNLGGVTALLLMLDRMGKPCRAVNRGPIPDDLKFLPRIEAVEIAEDCGAVADTCLVVDTPTLARTGFDWKARWPARTVVNIDHHPGNEMYGQINCVETSAPASCYLVYLIACELGMELDRELATCIFTGLMTDTGYFRYPNTTHETFLVASHLISCGARPSDLYRAVYDDRPFAAMALQGHALAAMRRAAGGELVWIDITREMLDKTGAAETDVAPIVGKLTTIQGVRIAVTFEERSASQTLVELRSIGDLDVGRLASHFGGGGHRNAAGCNFPGPVAEIREKLLARAQRLLEEPGASGAASR